MDINIVRSAVTLLSLLVFLLIVAWAYAGRNKRALDEQGLLPPDEYENAGRPQ
jgi:cytochrome c oxidase cbb3-type subunit 4